MGKQKQQVISRFFAPKPKSPPPNPSQNPPIPPPKISATVNFSPSKRRLTSHFTSPSKPSKIPKFSPHTHNPTPPPPPNPTLHKKFLQKLLEPSHDLPQPSKSKLVDPKYTPLEQQVVELKAKYPDVLLMVEVGYRFRFFGEDAENAARVLGIYAHMDHNFLTASVPTFRLNVHVRRLVSAGYKVGVVKQSETAAIKAHGSNKLGPFCRGLSALYTKATLEAAEDVGGGEEGCGSCNNYLVCVVEKGISVENKDGGIESGFDVKIGIIAVEISTGDVIHGELSDNFMRAGLEAFILSLSPVELLLAEPLSKQTAKLLSSYAGPTSNVRVEHTSRDSFNQGGALAEVLSLYESMSECGPVDNCPGEETWLKIQATGRMAIKGIMAMPDMAVQALALSIRHLKQFGLERILYLGASFQPLSASTEMTLSANTIQQLEVLRNNSYGSESGSLLQSMDNTLTIFGSRVLRHWVTHPLCDRNLIHSRLDAVSEIAESMGSYKASQDLKFDDRDSDVAIVQPKLHHVISSVLTSLGRSPDVQRGITRIFHRTATASEFIAIVQAILVSGKQLQELHVKEDSDTSLEKKTVHSVLLRKLILTASSSSVITISAKLLSALNKDATGKKDLQNLFICTNGQFPEVEQLFEVSRARTKVQLAKEKLDLLIDLYRKQLGKRNLEYTSVSGTTHLIELPEDMKVPSNWVKVNSTKKTIRYHPPEVSSALDQLSLVTEELLHTCRVAWDSFLKDFGIYYSEFQDAVQALASLDCLHSLAILSRKKSYVRPYFTNDSDPVQISIRSGRHPILETILEDRFVPNDTNLHSDGEYCQIITGPNMGGKSCYIRQVALIAIMAQVGSFVPACSATMHVLDGIYTRMGASDSIQQGRSTFLEELSEASQILCSCSPRSLVIIDELGRGTSTHDGVAIAYATLQYLLEQKRSMILFVTHYPKIVDLKVQFPRSVGAYHVSYLTSEKETSKNLSSASKDDDMDYEDVVYLYKLIPGVSESSFGFKVAQLAQLPSSVIRQAISMAAKLEMAINNRKKSRVVPNRTKEIVLPDSKAEDAPTDLTRCCNYTSGETEDRKEVGSAYREIFLNINLAISGENDLENCSQLISQAKRLALELT